MTHNEKRTSWWKEGIASLITGSLYGITNAVVGHPLDTIKTKMQVVTEYKGLSMLNTASKILKLESPIGFFRGVIPPILGSSLFRATQFSVFEAMYTYLDNHHLFSNKIPYTFNLELRVLVSSFLAGTARSIIECPFEYSKVQGQIGQKWKMSKMYQGFKTLWMRSTGLMMIYFILVDSLRRNTSLYNIKYGVFFLNGFCATSAFLVIWPLEIVKNQIQSQSYDRTKKMKTYDIIKQRILENGILNGLYRGSLPGLLSVFIRNGAAMIVMVKSQAKLTQYGFRN